ncbi:MAG: recombinase family protein [Cohaesibacter sp.]|nr:recombinase family protein [Cohaesibacter sp.]
MTKRAAIYARVSTREQTTENQLVALREVAERAGWMIIAEFVDDGVSGAKGRDKRPEFDALCKAVTRREIDIVLSWSVDRLGRSLQHLVTFLGELQSADVDLYLHQQGVDTTTPAGRALFQMMGIFAEFERSMIRERVKSGIERAKAEEQSKDGIRKRRRQGKMAHGRPRLLDDKLVAQIKNARENGLSYRKIAAEFGVSLGTVQNAIASSF